MFPVFLLLFQMEGCITTQYQNELNSPSITPIDIAKQNPQVNDFINSHPNSDISVDYYSISEVSAAISSIKSQCSTDVDAKEVYKVTINDIASKANLAAWVDWRNKEVVCVSQAIE
jgi:hypothetical protein